MIYYNKKIESTNPIIMEIHILYGALEIGKYPFTHLQCNGCETLIESREDHFLHSLLYWYFPAQAQLASCKVKPSIGLILSHVKFVSAVSTFMKSAELH